MPRDALTNAFDHFKRLDHILYVSLKYAKSEEVFENLIARYVDAYESGFLSLLRYMEDKKQLDEQPDAPVKKALLLQEKYLDEPIVQAGLQDYFILKKIRIDGFSMTNHYRKHVTVIANYDETIRYEIPDFITMHGTLKEFLLFIKSLLLED